MRSKIQAVLAAALSCSLLASCGGGGGTGTAAEPPVQPPSGGATGLLPIAPAPGTTLYADATSLLPLRAGAKWHYRGVSPDVSGTTYGVLVQQAADGANISAARQSTKPDNNQTLTYMVSGNNINATDPEALGPGSPLTYAVLRSPVRQGEQITIVERTRLPTGIDVDGDRIADQADLVIYSRVVGNEAVDLPDLQQTLTALRVDTTVVVRFHPSGGGTLPPLVTSVQSDWYAPGVGIVRSASTAPVAGSVPTAYESDERLVFFDGIGRGLGALRAAGPRDGNTGFNLGFPRSAVRSGNRVLVATDIFNDFSRTGMVLSALDFDGVAKANRAYPDFAASAGTPLLPTTDGVALVSTQALPPTPFVSYEIRLRRFDRDVAPVGNPSGQVLVGNLLLANVAAGSDGTKLWLMWSDASSNNSGTESLWLQDFDFEGRPIGAPRLLDSAAYLASPTRQFQNLALAAKPGRVVASWGRRAFGELYPTAKVALAADTGALVVHSLGVAERSPAIAAQPLMASGGQALFWAGQPGFSGAQGPDDLLLRGVALANDGTPLRSAAPTVDAELLASRAGQVSAAGASPGASDLVSAASFADGSRVQAAVVRNAIMLQGVDTAASSFIELLGWTPDSPLASTAPGVRRLRLDYVGFANLSPLGLVQFVVPLDDRLLVLGYEVGLTAAVIYRP
jgi:hypothetical protein